MLYDDLSQKAKTLLSSKHFTNIHPAPMQEKQTIFLALCGKKPVSHAFSAVWVEKSDGMHSKVDDERSISNLLSNLGLAFNLESDEYGTFATVSQDEKLVYRFLSTDDSEHLGKLLGFPETAVQAYDTEDMLKEDEQDKLLETAGLPLTMPQFCMSKTYASEELEVLKDWYRLLNEYEFI